MVEGAIFLAAVVVAVVSAVKALAPQVNGALTVLLAGLLGGLLALIDKEIGVTDMTVAQGILVGLTGSGVTTVADRIGVSLNK